MNTSSINNSGLSGELSLLNIDNDSNESKNEETITKLLCAACGKEGAENVCNKCDLVLYCNAACKKKHRHRHKEECERIVAELAEMHDIELFNQPSPPEDCPICMMPLPSMDTGYKYYSCCGKEICSGCIHAMEMRDNGVGLCPFCRTPAPNHEEIIKRLKKRIDAGDTEAIFSLGCCYSNGMYGLPQDRAKALELYHRAGELGTAGAYYNIGIAYDTGRGVERDGRKAEHYYELAAMGGVAEARYNLGCDEDNAGNWDRAIKHFMIAVEGGDNDSVKGIQQLYMDGDATKEDYSNALQAYQTYLDEIRSEQRDNAAAYRDCYKYY